MSLIIKRPRGFALAEIMVVLFAISLGMALVAAFSQQVMSFSKSAKQTSSVLEMTSRTTTIMNDLPAWLTSMRTKVVDPDGKSVFSACLSNSTSVSTYNCPANVDGLLNELGAQADGYGAASYTEIVDSRGIKLAGTPSSPHYLNSDGSLCSEAQAATKCTFLSTGFFLAESPDPNKAPDNVKFLVKFEKNSQAVINQNTTPFKTKYMSVEVGKSWLITPGSEECPLGEGIVKVGYLNDGRPQCLKATVACAANEIQLGLDANAQAICKNPSQLKCATTEKVILDPVSKTLVCSSSSPCSGPGEVFTGFYAGSGEPMCASNSGACTSGQLQMGLLPSGSPNCVAVQSCTLPKPLLSFDGTQFNCVANSDATQIVETTCPEGQSIVRIKADGSAECKAQDRNLAGTNLDCPAGHYVTGLHSDGSVKCAEMSPIVFGGMFQTYVTDGSCRIGNPATGTCSCPTGFATFRINDFNTGATQDYYEFKGMLQFLCYKYSR